MTISEHRSPYSEFTQLIVTVADGVAHVALYNPPVNILGKTLSAELRHVADLLDDDDNVRVVVFKSDLQDFFIAHLDVDVCTDFPDGVPYEQTSLAHFQQMILRIRQMRKATIGQVAGRARGGGSEFLLALDLRYAAENGALFCQPEIGFDILPGGGGTQRLTRLVGRGRALEMMLTGRDISATEAERIGYINRALPSSELASYVDAIALRIAHFTPIAIARIKECVALAEPRIDEGLERETELFYTAIRAPATVRGMAGFMASGGQSPSTELDLATTLGLPTI